MKVYQVLNLQGNPAGYCQHEFAIFPTVRKAKSWIKYMQQEWGYESASHTIQLMELNKKG